MVFDGKIQTMMNQHAKNTETQGSPISIMMPLLAMYLIWCSVSMILNTAGVMINLTKGWYEVIVPVAVVVYILIACFITQIFIVHVDRRFDSTPGLRLVVFIVTVGVEVLIYLWMARAGIRGNAISAVATANLIVLACVCASWMTHVVKRPSELVPLCVVAALADMFSVFAGPTKQLAQGVATYYETGMKGPPPLADFVLLKIAVPGIQIPMPLFGVSDWIILAFLSLALSRFGLSDNLTGVGMSVNIERKRLSFYFPVAALGLILAILAAQVMGLFLPALPFVVIFFLTYSLIRYPDIRKLEKKEWLLLAGFSLVMITLLVSGLYFRHR